jgi:NADH:ubiquinone oxidoreductase subunit 4 (subunit M)
LHGPLPERWVAVADAPHAWRKLPYVMLIVCLVVFGCFPSMLTNRIEPAAAAILTRFEPSARPEALAQSEFHTGRGVVAPNGMLRTPLVP